jgi:hypothetical protein
VDETNEATEPGPTEVVPVAEDKVAKDQRSRDTVSVTVLIVSVLVAALLAGLVGVVIGWKIEQQRVKDDVSNIRPIGTVTALDDDSVTIRLNTASGSKTYVLTDRTSIDGSGELVQGSTILVRDSQATDGGQQATRIIVLPDGTESAEEASTDD